MFLGGILVATYSARRSAMRESKGLAEQLLALAVAVDPRRVEEIAAERERAVQRAQRLLVVGSGPPAHAPRAEADLRDLPAGAAERPIAHIRIFPRRRGQRLGLGVEFSGPGRRHGTPKTAGAVVLCCAPPSGAALRAAGLDTTEYDSRSRFPRPRTTVRSPDAST